MKKLLFSFDIGHASIGWAVLDTTQVHEPQLKGCGSVLFPTDDCLASTRRQLRRQRRHIRSTRMRIARMKRLLVCLGVLTHNQLDEPGGPWPWKLAARVHAGGALLSWAELWDVLRWYAHNRGYDGNRKWSRDEGENPEDTEKEKAARALMDKLNMPTMCQTICAKLKVDPLSDDKKSSSIAYKTANAAFPREVVLHEVRELMEKHIGKLPQVTPALIEALCAEDNTPRDGKTVRDVLKQLGFDAHLPARFVGGLLFGQAVPRFDNRIIGECPVSGDKRPLKDCREFLEFRWAEIVANITLRPNEKGDKESLKPEERAKLTALAREAGGFTGKEFAKAINDITGCRSSNAELMMTHPDAEEALVLDPARRFTRTNGMMKAVWEHLPKALQSRITGRWNKHRRVTWAWMLEQKDVPAKLEATLKAAWDETKRKPRKGDAEPKWEDRVKLSIAPPFPSGRAPYGRKVMMQAVDEVARGLHPREKGGVLEMTEARLDKERTKKIDELTNNHLVRHRLKILLRLVKDMVREYAEGDEKQVERCVIEVARDLVEFSGKTNKEVAQELGIKLKNFKDVSKKLTADLDGKIPITAGLIRKARIADDLNWMCPYTQGKQYDAFTLAFGGVDKDHIIPRSARPSDSLDSLVITYSEVNKMKGNRTARKFIEEDQGKTVPGRPELSIVTIKQYEAFVNKLAGEKRPTRFTGGAGSLDDKRRQWSRKQKLMLRDYEEKEFTPGNLVVSSHLMRLSERQIEKHFEHMQDNKSIISFPGQLTGALRKAWKCLGCLATICPEILHLVPDTDDRGQIKLDSDGNEMKKMLPKPKGEIREITHLHHALDACVMAFAGVYLPKDGSLWQQIITRKVRQSEAAAFHQSYGWNKMLALRPPDEGSSANASFRLSVRDLPRGIKEQISKRLEERRVVQHVPADMSGARLEMNTWGVVKTEGDQVTLRQRTFGPNDIDAETGARKRKTKVTTEKASKLVGMKDGKLSAIQGALVIGENYGVALEPEPSVIAFHDVKAQLDDLKRKNSGKPVMVLRKGLLIRVASGSRAGLWRIISVKNTVAYGIAVDLALPDGTKLAKGNAPVVSLQQNGLEILAPSFCGSSST